jgi:hypothetical protein
MRFLAIIVLAIMLYGCAGQPYYSQVSADGGRCEFRANQSQNFSYVFESKEPFSFNIKPWYDPDPKISHLGPPPVAHGENQTRYKGSVALNGVYVFEIYQSNGTISLYTNYEMECSGES